MKIKRKDDMLFINVTPSATETYERIGKDVEDLTNDMNMNVESKVNILGESSINITKGNKQASVEPYIADSDDGLYNLLQLFIDTDSELDELKTDVVSVRGWDDSATPPEYPAIKEECYIEVVSYGGDIEGYQIPYNIHYTGTKTFGTFNPTTKTFTAS